MTESLFTPQQSTTAEMQATIANLNALIRAQRDALEALDVLWRARLVSEATDKVIAACGDDQQPTDDDLLQVDLWHDESLTRRIN